MSASCFSVAATSSSSTSLHLFTQKPKFSIDHLPLCSNTHFNFKIINSTKLKALFPISSLSRSLHTFAVSDGVDVVQVADDDKVENEENVESQSLEAGRLYVGNLPFSMTSDQLSEIFAEAGTVANVELVYDRVTDRSRGFAFLTMASVEEANEAIRLFDGAQVGGRTVKVNFPEVPKGGEREVMGAKIKRSSKGFTDSPHKLFVSNLSWGVTSQGLKDAFADQPGFLSAKVIFDSSGRSRGFGFITFSSVEAMNSALDNMNEVELEGRPLRLNLAEKKAPVSSPEVEASSTTDSVSSPEVEASSTTYSVSSPEVEASSKTDSVSSPEVEASSTTDSENSEITFGDSS